MKAVAIFIACAISFVCFSNLIPTNAWSQTVGYTYDSLNRLVQAVYPGGKVLQYSYDKAGNRIAAKQSSAVTSTTVASNGDPMILGGTVTFTATVTDLSSQNVPPVGTVQFKVDNRSLGPPVELSGGTAASLPSSSLSLGNHTVTASFTSSGNFAPSSGQLLQRIEIAQTSTTITSNGNPMDFGRTVTFTATVTDLNFQIRPAGTVQFKVDNSPLGPPVALSGGTAASLPLSSLSPGDHTVTASFTGSGNFAPSSGQLMQSIVIYNNPISVSGTASNYPEKAHYRANLSVNVTSSCGNPQPLSLIPPASTGFIRDASSFITQPRLIPASYAVGGGTCTPTGTLEYNYSPGRSRLWNPRSHRKGHRYDFVATSILAAGQSGGLASIEAAGTLNGASGYTLVLQVTEKDFEVYIYNPDGTLKFHGPEASIVAGAITISGGNAPPS